MQGFTATQIFSTFIPTKADDRRLTPSADQITRQSQEEQQAMILKWLNCRKSKVKLKSKMLDITLWNF